MRCRRRAGVAGVVVALGALVACTPAPPPPPPPPPVTEFASAGGAKALTLGPDGNIWFTSSTGTAVGKVTPSGVVTRYPGVLTDQGRSITSGPDGNLWVAQTDVVVQISTSGVVLNRFDVPPAPGNYNASIGTIVSGSDGNLWFTEFGPARLAKMTPTGAFTYFATASLPWSLVVGPDTNLWLVTNGGSTLETFTTAGARQTWDLGIVNPPPVNSLTVGSDDHLWFVAQSPNVLFRADTSGGIQWVDTTGSSYLSGISAGCDGNLWMLDSNLTSYWLTRAAAQFPTTRVRVDPVAPSSPTGAMLAVGNNLWIATSNGIGRYRIATC